MGNQTIYFSLKMCVRGNCWVFKKIRKLCKLNLKNCCSFGLIVFPKRARYAVIFIESTKLYEEIFILLCIHPDMQILFSVIHSQSLMNIKQCRCCLQNFPSQCWVFPPQKLLLNFFFSSSSSSSWKYFKIMQIKCFH